MKKNIEASAVIGLVANFEKPASRAVVAQAAKLIAASGRSVAAEMETASLAGLQCGVFHDVATLAREADLLLVFGGDGTILRVVRQIDGAATPILGINVGRLGFLTAVSSKDLEPALRQLWEGQYSVETRPLVEASGICEGKQLHFFALNDIVISHGAISRLIEVDVFVNDKFVSRYRGDGLIVSSPTGSTAYSLSAGGPIITPDADVFAITPICAHALSNRPIIFGLDSVVQVALVSKEMETLISADGQTEGHMCADERITIRRSRRKVCLVHPGEASFFETIRQKLHWRGSV